MVNVINEYFEKVNEFKKTLLQNIDINDLRHLSGEEFDMCVQVLDLFDVTIGIIKYEMITLETIKTQNELILAKLNKETD